MASEYFTTSETKKKQANYKGPSVDLRGEDAPQKDDYIKGSTTLLAGAQGLEHWLAEQSASLQVLYPLIKSSRRHSSRL